MLVIHLSRRFRGGEEVVQFLRTVSKECQVHFTIHSDLERIILDPTCTKDEARVLIQFLMHTGLLHLPAEQGVAA